jgi:hypothetical protein
MSFLLATSSCFFKDLLVLFLIISHRVLQAPVGPSDLPVIILLACLSLMPRHVVLHTVILLTGLTSESWHSGRMYLSRFTAFGYAPSVVGNVVIHGFGREFNVARLRLARRTHLNLRLFATETKTYRRNT